MLESNVPLHDTALRLLLNVDQVCVCILCLMRVHPPVKAQNAAFALDYGALTCANF
jgi:hypothetical protein